jgi:hypothetical protein
MVTVRIGWRIYIHTGHCITRVAGHFVHMENDHMLFSFIWIFNQFNIRNKRATVVQVMNVQ